MIHQCILIQCRLYLRFNDCKIPFEGIHGGVLSSQHRSIKLGQLNALT